MWLPWILGSANKKGVPKGRTQAFMFGKRGMCPKLIRAAGKDQSKELHPPRCRPIMRNEVVNALDLPTPYGRWRNLHWPNSAGKLLRHSHHHLSANQCLITKRDNGLGWPKASAPSHLAPKELWVPLRAVLGTGGGGSLFGKVVDFFKSLPVASVSRLKVLNSVGLVPKRAGHAIVEPPSNRTSEAAPSKEGH